MIEALIAFQLKHFICDFPLQKPYQYMNKGKYGHPGGVLHATLHANGTLLICGTFGLPWWLAVIDGIIHYHIDWAKTRLNGRWGLTPATEKFWWLLGLDQLLHQLTYLAIAAAA